MKKVKWSDSISDSRMEQVGSTPMGGVGMNDGFDTLRLSVSELCRHATLPSAIIETNGDTEDGRHNDMIEKNDCSFPKREHVRGMGGDAKPIKSSLCKICPPGCMGSPPNEVQSAPHNGTSGISKYEQSGSSHQLQSTTIFGSADKGPHTSPNHDPKHNPKHNPNHNSNHHPSHSPNHNSNHNIGSADKGGHTVYIDDKDSNVERGSDHVDYEASCQRCCPGRTQFLSWPSGGAVCGLTLNEDAQKRMPCRINGLHPLK